MKLKDFDELCKRDFDNAAVIEAIRRVFKERDELRHLSSECSGLAKGCACNQKPTTIHCNICGGLVPNYPTRR